MLYPIYKPIYNLLSVHAACDISACLDLNVHVHVLINGNTSHFDEKKLMVNKVK